MTEESGKKPQECFYFDDYCGFAEMSGYEKEHLVVRYAKEVAL